MACSIFRLAFLGNSVLETQISRLMLKTFNTLLIYINKIHYRIYGDSRGIMLCPGHTFTDHLAGSTTDQISRMTPGMPISVVRYGRTL